MGNKIPIDFVKNVLKRRFQNDVDDEEDAEFIYVTDEEDVEQYDEEIAKDFDIQRIDLCGEPSLVVNNNTSLYTRSMSLTLDQDNKIATIMKFDGNKHDIVYRSKYDCNEKDNDLQTFADVIHDILFRDFEPGVEYSCVCGATYADGNELNHYPQRRCCECGSRLTIAMYK